MSDRLPVIFAGGGTGGHLFPAFAVAEALAAIADRPVDPLYLCSTRPIDRTVLDGAGARCTPIPASPLRGSPIGAMRFAWSYLPARSAAKRAIAEHLAGARTPVVSTGGFVSVPCVHAARSLGLPVILLNLDAVPGMANDRLAKSADEVLSVFDVPQGWHRVEPIVRADAVAIDPPETCRKALGLDPSRDTLLVTGGSQGASTVSDLVLALLDDDPDAFAGWQAVHQCRADDLERARETYARAGVPAVVEPFVQDVGLAWGAASLTIGRAGAGTVAEARANAVPGVFFPYPWHTDGHQRRNAEPLERAGGALILTDHKALAPNRAEHAAALADLLRDTQRRARMRSALASMPPCDGARAVAARMLELLPG